MLEYDNSAFYYFALTLLVIYIIPGTWYALSEFVLAFVSSGEVGATARTQSEAKKAAVLKKKTTGFARLNTTSYLTNLGCLVFAWVCFLYLMTLVVNDGEVNTFDPYTILGVAQEATVGEIKKAYRKLSLKYHPDKNIGDKVAEEMFMRIAKAYEALTDETSKENYKKFGNPDGKQALEVSIGLPKIILENPKVVLVLYLIAMVVMIPSAVGWWYSNSKQYGEKNIKYETYNAFYTMLQESFRMKNLPEVIAASAECREINSPKPSDNEPMGLLYGKLKNDKMMVKPKYEHPSVLRGNLLLHSHLMRLSGSLNKVLMDDLNVMLGRTLELTEGLIEISHQRKWLDLSVSAIHFTQCVAQALWVNSHSLEQLPYVTAEDAKSVMKACKSVKTLSDFLELPDAEKKGLSNLSEDQFGEVLRVCALMPRLKIETKLFVEEEEEDFLDEAEDQGTPSSSQHVSPAVSGDCIYEQDLVTLRITLTRENLTTGSTASPAYAPLFPKTIRENWWVVLTDKPSKPVGDATRTLANLNMYAFEKVTDQGRKVVHEVRFMAPQRAGDYEMELQIFSDCYMGLDRVIAVPFSVRPASELPEFKAHPEDLELDNEPTLFEQVMAANVDESSDEEDEEEEEEEDEKRRGSSGAARGKKPQSQVVVEDVSDEEED
mmetsp:Transcript_87522/g.171189  ORF Transcript_87522/g.171189 Transcript_87522/m.171189 type:complete len:661 (+) Transcript_87522:73-2055(+)